MGRNVIFICLWLIITTSTFGASRSFTDIFPHLNEEKKNQVFSSTGYSEFNLASAGLQLLPVSKSGMSISVPVLSRRPSFFVENLLVCPYTHRYSGLITVYNALSRVQGLSGRVHRNDVPGKDNPVFKETTRIENTRRNNPLPDPLPATQIPPTETIYMRLKDTNFGNSYYRAELIATQDELFYTLSNFKSIYMAIFPIIKEDKFIAQLYIEPLSEGVLIYSIVGAEIPDIVMSKIERVSNMIKKRMDVIVDWLVDGIS
ncbi:hypothetical protein LQZ21_00515 [Treponema sp. TIM-1]|uniref:DUF6675 family protein n=1 Tax=Treponema sp. TIM-1 TaxID=2898417 RepID=UPI003980397A